ncbi:conserved hypothetical protein [delta proteobacterium NaphS2]|nr:conserved hypothetical protein [delta proteobacterium NaphS2]
MKNKGRERGGRNCRKCKYHFDKSVENFVDESRGPLTLRSSNRYPYYS